MHTHLKASRLAPVFRADRGLGHQRTSRAGTTLGINLVLRMKNELMPQAAGREARAGRLVPHKGFTFYLHALYSAEHQHNANFLGVASVGDSASW